jgi:4-amino-4-deoxy-L-arabinose transferase-like glycosyltransferase
MRITDGGLVPTGPEAPVTAFHPPLFPLSLALVSKLGGRSEAAHVLAGCAMGAATVVLVALLGRRLAGPRAGLIAGAVAAVSLPLIGTDSVGMSESLFGPAVAACLLIALAVLREPTPFRLAALGIAIGLAALTRGEGLFLLVLLALPLAVRGGPGGAGRLAIVALATVAVVAPWTARNWAAFDRPVLVTTSDGAVVAGANAPSTYYGRLTGYWDLRALPAPKPGNEAAFAAELRETGVRYAGEHLTRVPVVVAARVARTFGFWPPNEQTAIAAFVHGQRRGYALAALAFYFVTLLAAIAGVLAVRRRVPGLWVLLTPLALVLLSTGIAYGDPRLRVAFDVALAVLTGIAIDAALRRRRGSRLGLAGVHDDAEPGRQPHPVLDRAPDPQ